VQYNTLLQGRLRRFDRVLIKSGLARVLEARRHPLAQRVIGLVRRVVGR
jgi:hypothetical protein